jgi:hypothetical protein
MNTQKMLAYISLLSAILGCVFIIGVIPHTRSIKDFGHHFVPPIKDTYLPEYLLCLQVFLFLLSSASHTELVWKLSYFYWIRMFTMSLTILPSLRTEEDSIIRFRGFIGGHNDYLPISGHIGLSFLLSIYSQVWTYVFGLSLVYLSIAMRRHYTVEIAVSIILVYLL